MAAIFTEDLIIIFLQGDVHVDVPKAITDALATEDIEHPHDLGEFSKEGLDSAFKNLRYPPRRTTYTDVRGVLLYDWVGVLVDV